MTNSRAILRMSAIVLLALAAPATRASGPTITAPAGATVTFDLGDNAKQHRTVTAGQNGAVSIPDDLEDPDKSQTPVSAITCDDGSVHFVAQGRPDPCPKHHKKEAVLLYWRSGQVDVAADGTVTVTGNATAAPPTPTLAPSTNFGLGAVSAELSGFGGSGIVKGNATDKWGFDGAALWSIGSGAHLGISGGFEDVSTVALSTGNATALGQSIGWKSGTLGGRLGWRGNKGPGFDLDVGAMIANVNNIITGGSCATVGCISHPTVVSPHVGGSISQKVAPHVGVFFGVYWNHLRGGNEFNEFNVNDVDVKGGITVFFGPGS